VTHEELRDLLPAYALDALAPDEARAVEAHLATCAECQAELRGLRQVAAELGTGVPVVTPPAALRRQVIEAARPRARVIILPQRWGLALGAAAVAVIIALAGLGVALDRRLAAVQERLAAQEQTLALLASPSAKTAALAGTVPGNVRLVYDPERRQGALVVSDLRDPGANLVYQVWLIAGQQPESAGIFRPSPGRPLIIPLSADFLRYRLVAISIEPGPRGSPQPTTTPILSGTI